MTSLTAPRLAADSADLADTTADVLLVLVANVRFALPAAQILNVCPIGAVARLPGQPPEILGLANLRGRIGLVVCLARLLGLEPPRAGQSRFLVTLASADGCALAVESVGDVRRAGPLERTRAPAPQRAARPRELSGWIDTEFGFVEILDPAALCDFDTSGSAPG